MNSSQNIRQQDNRQKILKKKPLDFFAIAAEINQTEANADIHQHDVNKTNYANQVIKTGEEEE
jgi:hypothetical protein